MWVHRLRSLRCLEQLRAASETPWLCMPFSSISETSQKKAKIAPLQERRMIDRCKLYAKGGDGGNGCSSVRRSRQDRRGRPDGGNGGKGGDVILECSPAVWDFSSLQHHINAGRGGHGTSKNKIGTRGADKVVHIPVGTVIHLVKGEIPYIVEKSSPADPDPWELPGSLDTVPSELVDQPASNNQSVTQGVGSEKNIIDNCSSYPQTISEDMTILKEHSEGDRIDPMSCFSHSPMSQTDMEVEADISEKIQYNIAELKEKGQRIVVAQGGEGGLGNVSSVKLLKMPKLLKPEIRDDPDDALDFDINQVSPNLGSPGSEVVLILELKSIADVGLVGMPNAGKSTLLGAISRAKPTVGHYAFTTLRPNLGNVNYEDFSITVADIPGLIKGAHENRGLGHAFLRHIERTKVLAFVVDLAAGIEGRKGIPPWEQLRDLILELEHHQEGLSSRPSLVVANKIDEAGAEGVYEELKRRVQGVPIYPVCAVLDEGVPELKDGLRSLVCGDESYRLNIHNILVD